MKSKFLKYFTNWKVLLLLFVLVYFFKNYIISWFLTVLGVGHVVKGCKSENLTYTPQRYLDFADELKIQGFGESFDGTSLETISNVFNQMLTECDVDSLNSAFGKRKYLTLDFNNPMLSLQGHIDEEINQEDKDLYINDILATNNINYNF